jgi:hypothetical protein
MLMVEYDRLHMLQALCTIDWDWSALAHRATELDRLNILQWLYLLVGIPDECVAFHCPYAAISEAPNVLKWLRDIGMEWDSTLELIVRLGRIQMLTRCVELNMPWTAVDFHPCIERDEPIVIETMLSMPGAISQTVWNDWFAYATECGAENVMDVLGYYLQLGTPTPLG